MVIIVLLGGIVLMPKLALADPLRLDGNWSYDKSGGEEERRSSLKQTYHLSFDKALSAGAFFTGDIRYAEENQSGDDDTVLYNPSATLDLRNDLFSFNLNGSSFRRELTDGPDVDSNSWNVNWLSRIKSLPRLRLYAGQRFSQDDQTPHAQDSESADYGASVSHTLESVYLLYNLGVTENKNHVSGSRRGTKNHLGRIRYQESFLDRKLSVNLSEQVNYFEANSRIQTVLGNLFFEPLPVGALEGTFTAFDDTPNEGSLSARDDLSDLDFTTGSTEVLQSSAAANLGVRTNFNAINRLQVYFTDLLAGSVASQLSWTAFVSNNNFDWTPAPILTVSYENVVVEGNLQTVVKIDFAGPADAPLEVDYLKVVVDSPGLPIVVGEAFVSELEVGRVFPGTGSTVKSESDSLQSSSSLGLHYTPSETWSLGYNFNFTDTDNSDSVDRVSRSHSLFTTYSPGAKLSFTTNLNQNTNLVKQQQEQKTRSFSLSMHAKPLTTLNYSLGYTRSEGFTDSDRDYVLDTVTLYTSARIFPDLSSTLAVNVNSRDNLLSSLRSRSWNARLSIMARISPKVNVDTDYSYQYSKNDLAGSGEDIEASSAYGGTMTYRPSNVLYFLLRVRHDRADEVTNLSGVCSWRMTPRLELSENVSVRLAEADTGLFTTRLSWDFGRNFALDSSYTYQRLEAEDVDSVFIELSANF